MFNIKEYSRPTDRLSDYLPWAALIGPGLILNKDGSFQKTLRFRGPDLGSASQSDLMIARARLNEALRRLGSRWCLHVEARREKSEDYPTSKFPDLVSQLVDDERRIGFTTGQSYFETAHFLTLTYLPPGDVYQRTRSLLVTRERSPSGSDYDAHVEAFVAEFHSLHVETSTQTGSSPMHKFHRDKASA